MSYLCGHEGAGPSVNLVPACVGNGVRPSVMAIIMIIASAAIISTNLLVGAVLLKSLLKKGSQSWCFILNLALADALVGMAITGLAVEEFNHKNLTWNPSANDPSPAPGKTRCLMQMAFVMSPCTASIMSMFLISLDRYVAIKLPLRYSQLSGRGTAAGLLLALWISAGTIGFLPVMVRELQTDSYNGFCSFFSVIHRMTTIVFSVCFFPMLSVFIYIYLDILKIACSHRKEIVQLQQTGSRTSEQHSHQHPDRERHQPRSCISCHVKALRTVAMLVGCFLVLWCPFFVVGMVQLLCESCQLTRVLETYLWLLGMSNSLINPLVYACRQREVRLQLAAMFSCFTSRSPAAGTPGVAGRHNPLNVLTQTVGDRLNPALPQSIISRDRAHAVSPSATTNF